MNQISSDFIFFLILSVPVPAMTVSREKSVSPGGEADMVSRHWGKPRRVAVSRVPNASLGISIVGGKASDSVSILVHLANHRKSNITLQSSGR